MAEASLHRLTTSWYAPQGRAERLIAIGRVVFAVFSLAAIWLDPSEPARYAAITYALLSAYVIYALLLSLVVWRLEPIAARLRLPSHILDLGAFGVFMYLTEGPASPFFAYFVFALTAATVRWQWQGALWTAIGTLAVFLGLGTYAAEFLRDPEFELNRFIIRSVYLAVVATLLGYLGAYEKRLRGELARLGAGPQVRQEDHATLVQELLRHSANVLRAPRVLMTWEESEEPWLHVGLWTSGAFHLGRHPPTRWQPLVAEPLAGADFFCQNAGATVPRVVWRRGDSLDRWYGQPLHADLRDEFRVTAVVSIALRGESLQGRLLWLDKTAMTSDDLLLGAVVGRQVVASMDRFYLLERLRQSAAAEERVRLARDMHDGLLQSLTAVGLQLEAARAHLQADSLEMARQSLAEAQGLLVAEQADLRAFVQRPSAWGPQPGLGARLEALARSIERQWRLRVECRMDPTAEHIPATLSEQVFFVVREAVVNAAQHSGGTVAWVTVTAGVGAVHISVTDDGRGFAFRGRHDHSALGRLGLGPVSLRERVTATGGSLVVDSSAAGARLEITLPLGEGQGEESDAH